MFLKNYEIEGATNLDTDPCFADVSTYKDFAAHLCQFKHLLRNLVDKGESKTFYKFGDGDYFFLKAEAVGSATPGRRALSKSYSDIDHESFVEGSKLSDYYTVEIYPRNRDKFREVIPDKKIDFPAEYGYGLIANKWLTQSFRGQIGIIGAKPKVELIQKMMEYKEYQNHLHLDKFEDYIHIPQRFACDDIDATERMIAEQLKKSTSKIFLVGIGHVKSALLHRLKKYKDAVFLDVGTGIDALAGIVDHYRPYMGGWINHRIPDFDYGQIDILQYDIWNTPHKTMEK